MSQLFEEARRHFGRSLIEQLFSAPGAYWQNGDYFTKSPLRPQQKIHSFSINEKGQYYDFSNEEKGDLIDLVAESEVLDKVEAAKYIIKAAGGIIPEDDYQTSSNNNGDAFSGGSKRDDTPVHFIKDDDETKGKFREALGAQYFKGKYGDPVKAYAYRNFAGKIIFYTVRFVNENGKQVLPFYLTTDGRWKCKRPPLQKFPLYGGEKLKGNDLPYCIVEGEKCADIEIPGYIVLSWIGGSKAVDKTDWKVLEGREGIIFPDIDKQRSATGHIKRLADQPGMSAALKIKGHLPKSKIVNIEAIQARFDPKDGWDVADAKEEGINIPELINEVGFVYDFEVNLDPYDMYRKFITQRYGENNLDQFGGIFFRYSDKKHYWKSILSENIKPDIKTWIEKNNLIEVIKAAKKSPKTMINDIDSYASKHALDYINENPFKNSAIEPWIHHQKGAINVHNNGFDFHSREEKGEGFFKSLYPTVCLDYGVDEELFNNLDPARDCPGFYYYMSQLVPDRLKGTDLEEHERKKTIEMFSEILAYSLSPIKKDEFFFGLVGKEGTGKSFFIELLKKVIGEEFIVERRTKDTETRFASADFLNSKVFIEPDMASGEMLPDDFVKAYAGHKSITIENKFEKPIKGVQISIAMYFVSNHEIKVSSIAGINRRFIIIRFDNVLKRRDKMLLDKITGNFPHGAESGEREGETFDERPAILALALKGWLSFTGNNHDFTLPNWVRKEKEKWVNEANTAQLFMKDCFYERMVDEIEHVTGKEILERYKEWCKEEGIKHSFGRKRFYEEIRGLSNVTENNNGGKVNFRIINPEAIDEREEDEPLPF